MQNVLTTLAEHGDASLRSLLLQLLVAPPPAPPPLLRQDSSSSLSPRCVVEPLSLHAKLLQLMTSLETLCKRCASEFLFALCDNNGTA